MHFCVDRTQSTHHDGVCRLYAIDTSLSRPIDRAMNASLDTFIARPVCRLSDQQFFVHRSIVPLERSSDGTKKNRSLVDGLIDRASDSLARAIDDSSSLEPVMNLDSPIAQSIVEESTERSVVQVRSVDRRRDQQIASSADESNRSTSVVFDRYVRSSNERTDRSYWSIDRPRQRSSGR